MKISIIAAIGENRELGKDNKLLWHISEDLKRFKMLTQGHVVIMGRKTFESIGRPLPNRINIVITHKPKDFLARYHIFLTASPHKNGGPKRLLKKMVSSPNLIVIPSLEKAIRNSQSVIRNLQLPNEVFIIGGGQIYEQAMKYADKLYLTVVEGTYEADTFFPDYSRFKKKVYEKSGKTPEYNYKWIDLEK